MKKTILISLLCLLLGSCGWFNSKPEIAKLLSAHFENNLYDNFDTLAYDLVFKEKLLLMNNELSNPKVTTAFYQANFNKPVLTTKFYTNHGLDKTLINHLTQTSNNTCYSNRIPNSSFSSTSVQHRLFVAFHTHFATIYSTYRKTY